MEGDIWPARINTPELEWKMYVPDVKIEWDLRRFVPQRLWSGFNAGGQAQASTVSSVLSTASMYNVNTNMPSEVAKPLLALVNGGVTDGQDEAQGVIAEADKPVHVAKDSATEIGQPVQAKSGQPAGANTSEEEHSVTGHPNLVEELWRKHARIITPIAAETHEEKASPPADAAVVNTAGNSEESGSS